MRRMLLILIGLTALTALAVPAFALAGQTAPGDGTLAVRRAGGDTVAQPVLVLVLDGAVVGNIERGRLVVFSALGAPPVVTASDGTLITPVLRDDGSFVYQSQGSSLRFRAVGGAYKLRLLGRGIDVNVVGQGKAWLDGSLTAPTSDGMFSLNGAGWTSLPGVATAYAIGS